MADTIKSSSDLKLNTVYVDGDTRAITYPNPKSNLTSDSVVSLATQFRTNQFLVGDKTGAAFKDIDSAVIVEKTRRIMDLS